MSAFGSAAAASPAAAIRESVREFAIEARIARPSAPPTCCDVLISPDASPVSCGSTPDTAAIVIGTNANPSPTAATSDGNRMSPRYVPPTSTCANQTSAIAVSTRPDVRIGLNPNFVTSPDAMPADTMIPPASGRYASPDLIAL